MKTPYSTILALLLVAVPLSGMASNERPLQNNEHPTNLPGVTTIEAPPAGFNPINASDDELAYHGFPPRPDQNAQPNAYAKWVRAMNASETRIVPKLEQTAIIHGSPRAEQKTASATVEKKGFLPPTHDNALTNWIGYYTLSGASPFYYVESNFVVPTVQQAGCTGGWEYGSAWNGIDGWGSPDVLQAGVEFDAYCAGTTRSSYYSAWYEWYPFGEVRISGFPVAPGNELFVEVWHTSPTQGYAYLVNYNTSQAVQVGFTAYPGYPLKGNSSEWVVEASSAIHGMVPFWNANAYSQSGILYRSTSGTAIGAPVPMAPSAFVAVF